MPATRMNWHVINADILDRAADVLILSGNPQLNLSGGVGGAFQIRYGYEMQDKLHEYLQIKGIRYVDRGDVVVMAPCGSPYTAVVHAVGVDAFYDSSPETIKLLTRSCMQIAASHNAKTVAMAAIATGYGRMTLEDYASGIGPVMSESFPPIETVEICLNKKESANLLSNLLSQAPQA